MSVSQSVPETRVPLHRVSTRNSDSATPCQYGTARVVRLCLFAESRNSAALFGGSNCKSLIASIAAHQMFQGWNALASRHRHRQVNNVAAPCRPRSNGCDSNPSLARRWRSSWAKAATHCSTGRTPRRISARSMGSRRISTPPAPSPFSSPQARPRCSPRSTSR